MARLTARSSKRDSRYEKKSTEKTVAEMKSQLQARNGKRRHDAGRRPLGCPRLPGTAKFRSLVMVRWRRTGIRSLETWVYVSLFF